MHDEGNQENQPPSPQPIPGDLVVIPGTTRKTPRGRVEPQCFLDDATREGQAVDVREGRPRIADHSIDFVRDGGLDDGMVRQQVIGPRQRQRGRLVPGQQHRHDLVPDLSVGHACSGILVTRRQQHGQQVRLIATGAPSVGDESITT